MNPQNITLVPPMGPLAQNFHDAIISVDFDENDELFVEHALAEAIFNYCGIGLDMRAIVQRLIDLI
jgi:hypothetical protein